MAASQLTGVLDTEGVAIPLSSGVDTYGVDWRLQNDAGWDSPDLEEVAQERSGADGLWDDEPFYGGRTLTLEGKLFAPTYEAREAAGYRLVEAVPRDRLVQVTVNEITPKWVWARRSGRLMIRKLTDVISEFSISMLAPDPRKYGGAYTAATISVAPSGGGLAPPWTPPILIPAPATGPSQTTLTNAGGYNTPPTIIIHGPGSGISIFNYSTSLLLAFDLTLAAGDYLAVDVAGGTALLNGSAPRAPATGSCVISDFLMAKGDNALQIFGTLTTATPPSADISFYSAWI